MTTTRSRILRILPILTVTMYITTASCAQQPQPSNADPIEPSTANIMYVANAKKEPAASNEKVQLATEKIAQLIYNFAHAEEKIPVTTLIESIKKPLRDASINQHSFPFDNQAIAKALGAIDNSEEAKAHIPLQVQLFNQFAKIAAQEMSEEALQPLGLDYFGHRLFIMNT